MTALQKLWFIFKRVTFRNPQKSRVCVFDVCDIGILTKCVLTDIDFTPLEVRFERFYLTPQILFRMFRHRRFAKGWGGGDFYLVYLMACIDQIDPAVVISFNHIAYEFHLLSHWMPDRKFFTVTNGVMSPQVVTSLQETPYGILPPPGSPGRNFQIRTLFGWGQNDLDLYQKYGHSVGEYIPVGSFIAEYFKTEVLFEASDIEYDFCVISQVRAVFKLFEENPDFSHTSDRSFHDFHGAILLLDKYLARYLLERGKSCIIAPRFNNPRENYYPGEEIYYRKSYGERVTIPIHKRMELTTYRQIAKSRIIIGVSSSALYEALSLGKRVLCFDSFLDPCGRPMSNAPWSFQGKTYEDFRDRLDALLATDDETYQKSIAPFKSKLLFDTAEIPGHLRIRNRILKEIES